MSAAHTPGSWRLMPLEDGVEYLRIRGTRLGGRYKVCNVHAALQHLGPEVLESQANARLIAAAPDLLDALQEIVMGRGTVALQIDKARAAIAKATGGAA